MPIGGKDMYAISMWSKNAQNYGDYFNGFTPDGGETFEDFSKDWGSTSEVLLRKAFTTLGVSENELGRLAPQTENLRKLKTDPLLEQRFKGMIETRIKIR